MATRNSNGSQGVGITLPRHMAALNARAIRCGFKVQTRIGIEEGVQKLFADWQGPRSALAGLDIFKPGQLRRLPITRGRLFAGGYCNPRNLPLLIGMVTICGEAISYEVDFGEVPAS